MKYLLAFFILTSILYSCKDNISNNNNGVQPVSSVSGRIEDWGSRGGKWLRLQVNDSTGVYFITVDSTITDANGNFSFTLKDPGTVLQLFRERTHGACSVYFNSGVNDLKYTSMTINFRESNGSLSYLSNASNYTPSSGNSKAWYAYFDNIADVDGFEGCTSFNGSTSLTYNFSCAKGWNILYMKFKKYTNAYNYEAEVTNTYPGYMKWWIITSG